MSVFLQLANDINQETIKIQREMILKAAEKIKTLEKELADAKGKLDKIFNGARSCAGCRATFETLDEAEQHVKTCTQHPMYKTTQKLQTLAEGLKLITGNQYLTPEQAIMAIKTELVSLRKPVGDIDTAINVALKTCNTHGPGWTLGRVEGIAMDKAVRELVNHIRRVKPVDSEVSVTAKSLKNWKEQKVKQSNEILFMQNSLVDKWIDTIINSFDPSNYGTEWAMFRDDTMRTTDYVTTEKGWFKYDESTSWNKFFSYNIANYRRDNPQRKMLSEAEARAFLAKHPLGTP